MKHRANFSPGRGWWRSIPGQGLYNRLHYDAFRKHLRAGWWERTVDGNKRGVNEKRNSVKETMAGATGKKKTTRSTAKNKLVDERVRTKDRRKKKAGHVPIPSAVWFRVAVCDTNIADPNPGPNPSPITERERYPISATKTPGIPNFCHTLYRFR